MAHRTSTARARSLSSRGFVPPRSVARLPLPASPRAHTPKTPVGSAPQKLNQAHASRSAPNAPRPAPPRSRLASASKAGRLPRPRHAAAAPHGKEKSNHAPVVRREKNTRVNAAPALIPAQHATRGRRPRPAFHPVGPSTRPPPPLTTLKWSILLLLAV
jgi:hypothetical protein